MSHLPNHEEFGQAGSESQKTVDDLHDEQYGKYKCDEHPAPSSKSNDQIAAPFKNLKEGK